MANLCSNTLSIRGSKSALLNFINAGLSAAGIEGISNLSEIEKASNLKFSNWIPVPETYTDYDTTNHPDGEKLSVGLAVPVKGVKTTITEENISDIVQQYKEATQHQRDTYDIVGWYDFYEYTYGCKWNCSLGVPSMPDGNTLEFSFDTPWCPPNPWVGRAAEKFPDLEFLMKYHEPGCNFRGVFEAYTYDGELYANDEHWNMDIEDYKELGYDFGA